MRREGERTSGQGRVCGRERIEREKVALFQSNEEQLAVGFEMIDRASILAYNIDC